MKKKILFMAVAAATALAAPAAFADTGNVNVYGKLDLGMDSINNGAVRTTSVSSNVSYIGFKGSEDLGDGLSAVWQIEQQINIDNPGQNGGTTNTAANAGGSTGMTWASRNSFLGLSSKDIGTLILGRHDTPYKLATRRLDVFDSTIADNRSLLGGGAAFNGAGAHDARPNNVVAYISPKDQWGGFGIALAYVASGENVTQSTDQKGSIYSLNATYDAELNKDQSLYVAAAYQSAKTGTGNNSGIGVPVGVKADAWKIGIGYTINKLLQVGLVYEKTKDNAGANSSNLYGRSDWYLGGKYNFTDNDALKLAYGRAGNASGAGVNDYKASQWSLGYDHNLSKRTSLYAIYTRISNGTNGTYTFSNAGSDAGGVAVSQAGENPSAFAIGIKHTF